MLRWALIGQEGGAALRRLPPLLIQSFRMSKNDDTAAAVEDEGDAADSLFSEAYVQSLASLGLERLQNEPGRLHAEAIAVDEVLRCL